MRAASQVPITPGAYKKMLPLTSAILEAAEWRIEERRNDTIGPMNACIRRLAFGCLISTVAWGADKPVPLILEGRTTLHVGELAVLQIPADRRYSHFDGNTGAGNVLVLVRRSRHTALYRAVREGPGTIVIGPDDRRENVLAAQRSIIL